MFRGKTFIFADNVSETSLPNAPDSKDVSNYVDVDYRIKSKSIDKLDKHLLICAIVGLVILLPIIGFVGYYVEIKLNQADEDYRYTKKKNRSSILLAIYLIGTLIVIFIVILFMFYLLLTQ